MNKISDLDLLRFIADRYIFMEPKADWFHMDDKERAAWVKHPGLVRDYETYTPEDVVELITTEHWHLINLLESRDVDIYHHETTLQQLDAQLESLEAYKANMEGYREYLLTNEPDDS